MNRSLFALVVVPLFVLDSAGMADVISLPQVKGADPKRDCAVAIAKGDLRFLAVNGAAAGIVPGLDQYGVDAGLIAAHGSRTIRGTSDYKDMELNLLAWKYAEAYNRLLLAHVRGDSK